MREYLTPDFDVTIYEIEDVITNSLTFGPEEPARVTAVLIGGTNQISGNTFIDN